jgi:hypothetical protein
MSTLRSPRIFLPPGFTCQDCWAFSFCAGIGCTTAENTVCDFYPSRFRLSALSQKEYPTMRQNKAAFEKPISV